ncbi:MAG: alpha/beta hydrolase [Terracidiphilus sp.]
MSEFYHSSGTRLGFSDSGSGLPLVFLHPTPLDRDYWRPLIRNLPHFRAIVPDLRGHGVSELGSDLPVESFAGIPEISVLTMAQLAKDVLALVDHLRLPSAVFVGCSIGGYVLLEIWRIAPERVRGLAFICSKPQPDTKEALAKRHETISRAMSEGEGGIFNEMATRLTGEAARRDRPAIVPELRSRMTLSVNALIAVQAGLAKRIDSVPTVASIDVPVLAIAGGADASVSPAEMEAFQDAPGGCTFHTLPVAGHFAAYEQPRTIAALMTPWLRKFGL